VARKKSAASKEPKSGSKESKSEEPKPGNTLADKLQRIGVRREQDLVLHLPLRYEDRTHLCPLSAVKAGQAWQVEATVVHCEIQYRGRRQLVCLIEEGDAQLVLRFFHFYPSQHKALAPGRRVRAFGDVRESNFGLEMIHPAFQIIDIGTPLPDRLTPVYPTTAGLAQAILTDIQRGYDVTRLDEFPAAVKALTRDQVNSAIKNHLNPGAMVLVQAGSVPQALPK